LLLRCLYKIKAKFTYNYIALSRRAGYLAYVAGHGLHGLEC